MTPDASSTLPTHEGSGTRLDFERLALPHVPSLRRLASRLVRDPDGSEDLVQDALIRAWSHWHQFDPATNCRAWLSRILTTTFINGYRRRKKEREILAAERAGALGDRFTSSEATRRWSEPEQAFLDRHLSRPVTEALASLRPEFRAVVTLSDLMELPYRDVAETLEIPIGTVMSRLFRARQALRRELAGHARAFGLGAGQGAAAFAAGVAEEAERQAA
jgi:RNA polymerase sigma-70 factor (ECF subfamily)